jgi:hypothetical protein
MEKQQRTTPFMMRKLEHYNGERHEMNPDHHADETCAWCGKSLKRVGVLCYPMLGDACCNWTCGRLLDDWLFNNVVDPEGEIDEILAEQGDE